MIRDTADPMRLAADIASHGGEISMELGPDFGIKKRAAFLRAENDVNNDEAQ